jgi:peptidoglycan/LPS O-acetylase OafA/YrhL
VRVFLAQAAPELSDLWGLGAVAVAVLVGAAVSYRWIGLPERQRADRLEAELRAVNVTMAEKWLPALDAARRAVERRRT